MSVSDSAVSSPTTGLELRSTMTDEGLVTLAIRGANVPAPGADEVVVRVEITTTFASSCGMRLSLADAVDPDQVRWYGRMVTGDQALITRTSEVNRWFTRARLGLRWEKVWLVAMGENCPCCASRIVATIG
jgi:hypothetical protein